MVDRRSIDSRFREPIELPTLEPSTNRPVVPTTLPDTPAALATMITNLTAMLPAANPAAKAYILSLIAKAEIKKNELEADANFSTMSRIAAATSPNHDYIHHNDSTLTKAMFGHFNPEERQYFGSIDPTKNYKILSIDQNGNLIEGQSPREVSGAQLREDFARLKFHTLSPQEQQRVREQTPAETPPANASPDSSKPSAEPAKPGTLQADKQEMQQLQESMTRLEGHEAQRTVERHGSATDAARHEIRGRHQHFERAREISGEIIDRVEQVETREAQVRGLESIAHIPIPMMPNIAAMALPIAKENLEQEKQKAAEDIKKKREELGQTIQDDVINKGLLGTPQEPSQERSREQQAPVQVSGATDIKPGDAITPGNTMAAGEKSTSRVLT